MTVMKRPILLLTGIAVFIFVIWAGARSTRAGVESPDYRVLTRDGDFEVRRYDEMIGAATAMQAAGESGRNSGFGRLFRFISGGNEREEKIAMTSPVFVETDDKGDEKAMIFVMPKATVAAGVPDPSAAEVTVKTMKAGDFAALRFKGYRSREAQQQARTALMEKVAAAGLQPQGEPVFAYYDPPWIPESLRRNEVLVRVTGVKADR